MGSSISRITKKYLRVQLTDSRENRGDVYFGTDHKGICGMKLIRKNQPNLSDSQDLQLFLCYENIPSNTNSVNWYLHVDNTTSNRDTSIEIEECTGLISKDKLIIKKNKKCVLSRILYNERLGFKIQENSQTRKISDNEEDRMKQLEPIAKLIFHISAGNCTPKPITYSCVDEVDQGINGSKTKFALDEMTGKNILEEDCCYTPDDDTNTLYKIDIYATNDKKGFKKLKYIRFEGMIF